MVSQGARCDGDAAVTVQRVYGLGVGAEVVRGFLASADEPPAKAVGEAGAGGAGVVGG